MFLCKQCKLPLESKSKQFCNRSCSASYNNKLRRKTRYCKMCSSVLAPNRFNGTCCDNRCQQEYLFQTVTLPRIERGEVRERSTLRKFLVRVTSERCSKCENTTWEGCKIPLEVDHIDGNASNNYPINLRLLCPNCHALTDTYKNRNKGSGRKSRGMISA